MPAKPNNKSCCVYECRAKFDREKEIYIHRFPRDKRRRKIWKNKLKIRRKVTDTMYVCSQHFVKDNYYFPEYSNTLKLHRLKMNAVPSLNIPGVPENSISTESSPKTLRSARYKARELRKQVDAEVSDSIEGQEFSYSHDAENPSESEDFSQTEFNLPVEEESVLALLSPHLAATYEEKAIQVNVLHDVLSNQKFRLTELITTSEKLRIVTGLPSFELLHTLAHCVDEVIMNKSSLTTTDRIVLVMTKLKVGVTFNFLAILFGVSRVACKRVFQETVAVLSQVLSGILQWPSKEEILKNLPHCFSKYRKTRVVLDCTEIIVEKSPCLSCRILTYSHYYKANTVKLLVGVSPAGLITFISSAYGGRVSDKAITEESGVYELLEPYQDDVMVDKGFRIESECLQHAVGMIRPPFLSKNSQLSASEAKRTGSIASARVHVERAIQCMKMFNILKMKLEWFLLSDIDNIAKVICAIVNLSPPILADNKFV